MSLIRASRQSRSYRDAHNVATTAAKLRPGELRDSVRLRAAELMGNHYGLFTDQIGAVAPECSPEEIAASREAQKK